MSKTVFTKVDYDLGSLVKYIGLGEIGLPVALFIIMLISLLPDGYHTLLNLVWS